MTNKPVKTVLFHSNQLCLRGTEIALYDYALYNETILKNKSIIVSDKNKNLDALQKFKDRFTVYLYDGFEECNSIVDSENVTHFYAIKAGYIDNKVLLKVPNIIHVVFTHNEPHGEVYTYISRNLARAAQGNEENYLPHIVDLPSPTANIRQSLGIPENATVFGRHGGYEEFNLGPIKEAVIDSLNIRKDIHFIFLNTEKFVNSDRVHFLPGTYSLQDKSNFINSTDCMIHARYNGESFGLAICEFLFFDKPIISWLGGLDKNHIELLNKNGLWYNSKESCIEHLVNFDKNKSHKGIYSNLVSEFTPEKVMVKFNKLLEESFRIYKSV